MPSKHKEARTFLKKGFFEGLKSFRDFEIRTEQLANTKEVGDAFEILVEAYLHLNPVLNAKDVWLVGEVPLSIRKRLNLPHDTKGIDGVYEDAAGNLIPYLQQLLKEGIACHGRTWPSSRLIAPPKHPFELG